MIIFKIAFFLILNFIFSPLLLEPLPVSSTVLVIMDILVLLPILKGVCLKFLHQDYKTDCKSSSSESSFFFQFANNFLVFKSVLSVTKFFFYQLRYPMPFSSLFCYCSMLLSEVKTANILHDWVRKSLSSIIGLPWRLRW